MFLQPAAVQRLAEERALPVLLRLLLQGHLDGPLVVRTCIALNNGDAALEVVRLKGKSVLLEIFLRQNVPLLLIQAIELALQTVLLFNGLLSSGRDMRDLTLRGRPRKRHQASLLMHVQVGLFLRAAIVVNFAALGRVLTSCGQAHNAASFDLGHDLGRWR